LDDFYADWDSPALTRITAGLNYPLVLNYGYPLEGYEGTLNYLDSGDFIPANLTADGSKTAILCICRK